MSGYNMILCWSNVPIGKAFKGTIRYHNETTERHKDEHVHLEDNDVSLSVAVPSLSLTKERQLNRREQTALDNFRDYWEEEDGDANVSFGILQTKSAEHMDDEISTEASPYYVYVLNYEDFAVLLEDLEKLPNCILIDNGYNVEMALFFTHFSAGSKIDKWLGLEDVLIDTSSFQVVMLNEDENEEFISGYKIYDIFRQDFIKASNKIDQSGYDYYIEPESNRIIAKAELDGNFIYVFNLEY